AGEDLHRDAEEGRPGDPADGGLGRRQEPAQHLGFADRGDPAADGGAHAESAAAGPARSAARRARSGAPGDAAMTRRGFTLLEVMIAIAVLAMIGGLTWKSFDGAYDLERDDAGRTSLFRRVKPQIDEESDRGGEKAVLAEDVLRFSVQAWDPRDREWRDEWQSDSPERTGGALVPPRVRIAITVKDEQ